MSSPNKNSRFVLQKPPRTLSNTGARRKSITGMLKQNYESQVGGRTSSSFRDMQLEVSRIPWPYNILASFFSWLLLAACIACSGTFASISNSRVIDGISKVGKTALKSVQNSPLLWTAAICYILGFSGISWLWWKWQYNYILLRDKIFL